MIFFLFCLYYYLFGSLRLHKKKKQTFLSVYFVSTLFLSWISSISISQYRIIYCDNSQPYFLKITWGFCIINMIKYVINCSNSRTTLVNCLFRDHNSCWNPLTGFLSLFELNRVQKIFDEIHSFHVKWLNVTIYIHSQVNFMPHRHKLTAKTKTDPTHKPVEGK